ncbi:FMN adenylylate transferase [Gracilibacillus halophilus YIM-C55.5]|uniref:Riboflavin biosynthesis protein n=1 Tax=Gracilibacillus halophilus YIM-C55.5 TaxID=1308866 RepID=N4W8E8_9BACI|nr:bifunctional riboflavin kinase/FAD synthetase [Gracilibacillus halophilus]ENH96543.1 FMN adenylylate transferase [Gracilibacillus halophilus YIM-C55.5]
MEVITLSYPNDEMKSDLPESIAAIGFFDGIHRGHQKVIRQAVSTAQKEQKHSVVITFDPHPSVVLQKPKKEITYLTPYDEKVQIFERLGVDQLYVIHFNHALSQLSPEEFIDLFIHGLNIQHIIAGFDFTFGYKGLGNMENIRSMVDQNINVSAVEKVEDQGEKISSTRIRHALQQGNIDEANRLLGYSISVRGEVVTGDQRGRTIGYPTANLYVDEPYYLPRIGVYAVEVDWKGQWFQGMANVGYNPTFVDHLLKPKIEVHLFDTQQNLYGETLRLYWRKYIRDEEKFDHVDELIDKLKEDEHVSRQFFAKND